MSSRPPYPQFPSWTTAAGLLAVFTKKAADAHTLSTSQSLVMYAEVEVYNR